MRPRSGEEESALSVEDDSPVVRCNLDSSTCLTGSGRPDPDDYLHSLCAVRGSQSWTEVTRLGLKQGHLSQAMV